MPSTVLASQLPYELASSAAKLLQEENTLLQAAQEYFSITLSQHVLGSAISMLHDLRTEVGPPVKFLFVSKEVSDALYSEVAARLAIRQPTRLML